MTVNGWRRIVVGLVLGLSAHSVLAAEESASTASAAELTGLMEARKATVIAAPDPADPGRFVAAMLFPRVQLLVVSARYPAPDVIGGQIAARQYADVYSALQQSSPQDSRVFFQDLGADGLHAKPGDTVDVMYEHVVAQTIFDGNPAARNLSNAAYGERFKAADAVYSRMLNLLIQQLRGAVPTP